MAIEDTIRQMLQEKKEAKVEVAEVDTDKVKAELKKVTAKIKQLKADGKDFSKLKAKAAGLRKQLKESFDELEETGDQKSSEYTVDGVNVVDANGDIVHVADDAEEAESIVAKLNSELQEAADSDKKEEEEEEEEDKPFSFGGDDEDAAADGDEEVAADVGDVETAEGDEEVAVDGDESEDVADDVEAADDDDGELPDDERVTVVVVSPEHEDDAQESDLDVEDKEDKKQKFAEGSVMESLLSGEQLSEEFKEKTRVIFETALNEQLTEHKKLVESKLTAKYNSKLKTIREEYDTKLTKQISTIEDTIVEKIDAFLSYEVDQWVNENKVALVGNLRSELTEEFIDGLKGLFKEHYIDVPDEKFDLIGAQEETIHALETKLEESVKSYSDLSHKNKELQRKMLIAEVSQGLTETQKLRFEKLTEKVGFESAENFSGKLSIIKESYFGKKAEKEELLTEATKEENKKMSSVDVYAEMLRRQ